MERFGPGDSITPTPTKVRPATTLQTRTLLPKQVFGTPRSPLHHTCIPSCIAFRVAFWSTFFACLYWAFLQFAATPHRQDSEGVSVVGLGLGRVEPLLARTPSFSSSCRLQWTICDYRLWRTCWHPTLTYPLLHRPSHWSYENATVSTVPHHHCRWYWMSLGKRNYAMGESASDRLPFGWCNIKITFRPDLTIIIRCTLMLCVIKKKCLRFNYYNIIYILCYIIYYILLNYIILYIIYMVSLRPKKNFAGDLKIYCARALFFRSVYIQTWSMRVSLYFRKPCL